MIQCGQVALQARVGFPDILGVGCHGRLHPDSGLQSHPARFVPEARFCQLTWSPVTTLGSHQH